MCKTNDLSAVVVSSGTQDLFQFKKTFNLIGVGNVSFETSTELAPARIATLQPDILLVSTMIAGLDSFELGRQISMSCPSALLLFFSTETNRAMDALKTLAIGGMGYIQGSDEHQLRNILEPWVTVAKNTRNLKEFVHGRPASPEAIYA